MSNDINILDPNAFFKISGNVHHIREREYNGTVTKYLMIEDDSNPEWPNYYEVEFYKDKANLVTGVQVGDFVTCNINFGGRKWQDKNTGEIKGCFFSLKGWKIEVTGNPTPQAVNQYQNNQHESQAPVYVPPQEAFTESSEDLEEDCPF